MAGSIFLYIKKKIGYYLILWTFDHYKLIYLKHTGKLRSLMSTGLWKGQAYWCLHTALRTVFCRYWSWFVLRPFGRSLGFDCSPGGQDDAGEAASLASESFCMYIYTRVNKMATIPPKGKTKGIQSHILKGVQMHQVWHFAQSGLNLIQITPSYIFFSFFTNWFIVISCFIFVWIKDLHPTETPRSC